MRKPATRPSKAAKTSEKAVVDDDPKMTIARAAELLGVSRNWLGTLAKDGYIERDGDRVRLSIAARGLLRYAKDEKRKSSTSAAVARIQDARAREIEMKIQERDGRLVPLTTVNDFVDKLAGIVRSGLSALPARVTRDLVLRRKFETEINATLNECADAIESDDGPLGKDRPQANRATLSAVN